MTRRHFRRVVGGAYGALLLFSSAAWGQWLPSGATSGPIYYNGGNVGIGTSSPGSLLTVAGSTGNISVTSAGVLTGGTNGGSLAINAGANTNNNITISPASTGATYLSYSGGTGGIYFGNGANGVTGIIQSSGNVGIGTTNPSAPLDVYGSGSTLGGGRGILTLEDSNPLSADNGGTIGLRGVYTSAGSTGMFGAIKAGKSNGSDGTLDSYLSFYSRNNTAGILERMRIDNNGNVGIGTTAPQYGLDVAGNFRATLGSGFGGVTLQQLPYPNQGSLLFSSDRTGYTFTIGNKRYPDGNVLPIITMYDGGNVGIGTTTPQYPLSVNGTVQAKEVLVNTGWSDYVFDPGYRLAPLSEVSAYLAANHHLPDIPSAAEVKEKGVSLGDMQAKLLAKVEELTLHMIEAEERSKKLEQENLDLRQETQQLREQVEKIAGGMSAGVH